MFARRWVCFLSSEVTELFLRMKLGIHPLLFRVSVGVGLLNVEEKVQPEDGLEHSRADARRLAPPGGEWTKHEYQKRMDNPQV